MIIEGEQQPKDNTHLNFVSPFKWIVVTRVIDKRLVVAKYYRFGVHSANISYFQIDNGGVELIQTGNTNVWGMKIA